MGVGLHSLTFSMVSTRLFGPIRRDRRGRRGEEELQEDRHHQEKRTTLLPLF
jgi:hypothetical protein